MSKPVTRFPSTRGKRITIGLSLGGRMLTKVELSPLEYAEIHSKPLEDAVRLLFRKDPRFRKDTWLAAQFINYIAAGQYSVEEDPEGREEP